VKIVYRQTASDDIIRQFQYYLIDQNLPEVAARFRDAVKHTVESLRQHPLIGARYRSISQQLRNLRSWPVAGFEAIRIYYLATSDVIEVIRVLHGKRDLKQIFDRDRPV
jgi:toxin ParE1/3/4